LQQLLLSPVTGVPSASGVGFACVASPKTKGQSCFLRLQQQCSKQAEAGLPAVLMLIFAPYQHDPNKRLLPAALVQSERLLQPQATKNLLLHGPATSAFATP
jgi:hypothetical protein